MEGKLFPIGISTFEQIRRDGYMYVDKTRHVYGLSHTGKYYFLSRPRRFGKSLLVSTLESYFLGKRELFEGLAIDGLEQEWTKYPVLHLDLSNRNYQDETSLTKELNSHLEKWEAQWGTQYQDREIEERFRQIIELAYKQTGRGVVILVDEYDKPLLSTMLNEPLQSYYRAQLKAFYGVLKKQDPYIRFALLTGVTKFSKVSIFSDLNNLMDISLMSEYADICGITEEEIHQYFEQPLHQLAQAKGLTYEAALEKLRARYDGYHFGPHTVGVYNPFSLLCALRANDYGSYWFETGTPTFLLDLLRQTSYDLEQLTHEQASASTLSDIEGFQEDPVPMLYQSGYLTITDYDDEFGVFTLGFPNQEVAQGFCEFIVPHYAPVNRRRVRFLIGNFVRSVNAGDADGFMRQLQALYDGVDYQIIGTMEKHFHNSLFLIFHLMGFYTQVERHTSRGSIDIVVQTPGYIYLIECKLDKSAREALQQIEDKHYADAFATDSRRLFKIGLNFSSATRSISEYVIA